MNTAPTIKHVKNNSYDLLLVEPSWTKLFYSEYSSDDPLDIRTEVVTMAT